MALTMSLCWSCWSLMMKIMSKRDRMVGMKSMLSSPFVSSQRPNTELAAASTEQREFRVVVMPAWEEHRCCGYHGNPLNGGFVFQPIVSDKHLSDGDGLLLHGLVDRHSVVFSHLGDKNRTFTSPKHWRSENDFMETVSDCRCGVKQHTMCSGG